MLGAQRLRLLIAYLVVISVGTLLAGIGQLNVKGIAAALYYLPHTTWVTAGLFLLADLIAQQRGPHGDGFTRGPLPAQPARLGLLFFLGAVAAAGLPPLSGFIGKVLLLRSVAPADARLAVGGGLACRSDGTHCFDPGRQPHFLEDKRRGRRRDRRRNDAPCPGGFAACP